MMIRRLVQLFYRRTRIIVLAMDCGKPTTTGLDLNIIFKEHFENDEALQDTMRHAGNGDPELIKRRQKAGDLCYQVLEDSKCIHYSWVSRRLLSITEVGLEVPLTHQHRWAYDAYTLPLYRGRSIFPNVLRKIVEDAQREGCVLIWVGVENTNRASLNAIRKACFIDAVILERTVWLSCFVRGLKLQSLNRDLFERFNQLRKL